MNYLNAQQDVDQPTDKRSKGRHFIGHSIVPLNTPPPTDPFDSRCIPIDGFDHIEIYTESVRQTAFFLSHAFGFTPFAYRGLETGWDESQSVAMKQGAVIIQLTSPLKPDTAIARHISTHGFSVKDIAFRVPNAEEWYHKALHRGALSGEAPTQQSDAGGDIVTASIMTYGDTIHSFVDRSRYSGLYWPGFVAYEQLFPGESHPTDVGIRCIDHIVGNVELDMMNYWVQFYETVFGFQEITHFTDKQITSEYSALMSKIIKGGGGKIILPINEPAKGKRKSQIQEFLDFNGGPGVQHLAFETDDIIATVKSLRSRGVRFISVPSTYYSDITSRVGDLNEDLQAIASLGILADRDEEGYILQIFTKNLQDRPTLFLEIIQRSGSRGFGAGNFKALFQAIEKEQEERGNL